jgi:hypothetical protein
MKNLNYVLFYKIVHNFSDNTTAWVRRNRNSDLVKRSTKEFKKSESQLEKVITDRRQMGLKYKNIFT